MLMNDTDVIVHKSCIPQKLDVIRPLDVIMCYDITNPYSNFLVPTIANGVSLE